MLEVTYYVACTLDGFIADPEGGLGWLEPFEGTGEDYGYAAFCGSVDAVLLGRATFEFAASLSTWPYGGKPTWVFTHSSVSPLPPETQASAEPPSAIVGLLRSMGHRHAYLVGGGKLAASFRAAGLITRYIVSVVPVILGGGLPMLAPANGLDRLELVGSTAFPSGIVQLEYGLGRDA